MKTEYLYTDLFNMLIEGLKSLEPSEEIAGEAANVLIEMKADIASLKQQLSEAKKDAERYREALESVANSNYMPIGLVHTIRSVLYNQAMREGE